MQWLLKALVKKLSENAVLGDWLGTDGLGRVRIYQGEPPPLEIIGGTDEEFRYLMISGNIAGGPPTETYDDTLVEDWDIQFSLFELSTGTSNHLTEGYELLKDVFEPRSTVTLDDPTLPEYQTVDVRRMTPLRGPEVDYRGAWMGTVDYNIRAQEL